jgi:hypothetical protein
MIYGLVRLIFNIKSGNKGLGIGGLILWLVCLFSIIGIVAFESSNYSDFGKDSFSQDLDINSDTLHIEMNDSQEDYLEDESIIDLDDRWFLLEDAEAFYGKVDVDIIKANGDVYSLEIEKESKGRSWETAKENANNIDYGFRILDNRLILDPYYSVDLDHKWRFPRVETTIRIPEGKVVVLDRKTRDYLEGIRNVDHLSDWNMAGKTWKMTEEGLELVAK